MTGSVSLTEQFGAMAVIDELQRQALEVQDHLNLPARRAEAAASIRRFYQSQGVAVDEALLEQGVHDYFDRRLTFEASPMSSSATKIATLYVTRDQWLAPLKRKVMRMMAGLGAGLCLWTAYATLQPMYQQYQQDSRIAFIRGQRQAYLGLEQAANNVGVAVVQVQVESKNAGVIPGEGVAERTHIDLLSVQARYAKALRAVWPENGPIVADDLENRFNQFLVEEKALEAAVQHAAKVQRQIQGLLTQHQRYQAVVVLPEFKDAAKRYDKLDAAWKEAGLQLAQRTSDVAALPALATALSATTDMYGAIDQVSKIVAQAHEIEQSFAAMRLAPAEKSMVSASVAAVTAAADALNLKGAEAQLAKLSSLHGYAKAEVTLKITNRAGVKTGVERTFNAGGGKAWYLIVDAEDAAGNRISVPFEDSEKGVLQFVSTFGVEIPEAVYQTVKAEKKSSGKVRDRLLGNKPKDSLTIQYAPRAVRNPNLISSW